MSQTVFRVGPKTVTPVDADVPREIVVTTNRTGQDTTPPCPRCRGIVWTVVEAERKWSMRDDPPKVQRLRCAGCGWLRHPRQKYAFKEGSS